MLTAYPDADTVLEPANGSEDYIVHDHSAILSHRSLLEAGPWLVGMFRLMASTYALAVTPDGYAHPWTLLGQIPAAGIDRWSAWGALDGVAITVDAEARGLYAVTVTWCDHRGDDHRLREDGLTAEGVADVVAEALGG